MRTWHRLATGFTCALFMATCSASRSTEPAVSTAQTAIDSAPTTLSSEPGQPSPHSAVAAPDCPDNCTLGQLATQKGVRIGAAVNSDLLKNNPAYAEAVSTYFNAVTPENVMKWTIIHPAWDQWNWTAADDLVNFAEANNMSVKGTTLVWGQEFGNGLPDWMRDITDPEDFKQAMIDSITTQVTHFKGRVSGWDVVNEPLRYNGPELDQNVFLQRLGIDYIALAFRTAHAADPDAKLWLNEAFTEYYPARADAVVALAKSLVDAGVPITGVGLQTHLIINTEIPAGSVDSLVLRLQDLGLEVGLSEVDVPLSPQRTETDQVALYTQVIGECLNLGCNDITVWGVSDGDTWLDDKGIRGSNVFLRPFSNPSNPLLLDRSYKPKPAYFAVLALLKNR